MPKFLCLQRRLPAETQSSDKPSPAQMQAMYAKFNEWREKFRDNIEDLGGRLGSGRIEEQDRSAWDQEEIATGLHWLVRSADGPAFSRYHAEARIAAEHCMAPSVSETRWDRIVASYTLLEQLEPSVLHTLNRAVALALAEWKRPAAGLALLASLTPPLCLTGSYHWDAVLADLHRRAGNLELADEHRACALACAPSTAVRAALERRLRGAS